MYQNYNQLALQSKAQIEKIQNRFNYKTPKPKSKSNVRIVSYIPQQAEINKFLNGQIDPLPLLLPSQQLNLLHNMNPPPDLQIRAVHVPNHSGEGGRVQPAGLEVPQEPRHRPPPQIRRVQLRPHGPAAGGEEAVPIGLNLAAVGEAEPRRDVGPGELP